MVISETCACGAAFSADGDNVVRLVREWRKTHVCFEPKPDASSETIFTSASTVIESVPLGFAPAEHPGRKDTGFDE